jgi:Glycosyltransferase family 20
MLAYDLIGFQTDQDRANFTDFLRNDLRIPSWGSAFRTRAGTCRLATFPIGIDAQDFADRAQKAAADPEVRRLRASLTGSQLIIGVDRIDYSKGLIQRFRAMERLQDTISETQAPAVAAADRGAIAFDDRSVSLAAARARRARGRNQCQAQRNRLESDPLRYKRVLPIDPGRVLPGFSSRPGHAPARWDEPGR